MKIIEITSFVAAFTMAGCGVLTSQHKEKIHSALEKRDAICEFVQVWAGDKQELAPVLHACETGEKLENISEIFEGCMRGK